MHLTFPKHLDRFSREEVRCLSAALGFPPDIFTKHLPLTKSNGFAVKTKVIFELIDRKVFNNDLHRTSNLHDGVYNAKVLEKAVHVLSNRIISFTDLKDIRIAFQFYECEDLSGLEINCHIILRTLKMCGRVMSPRKLMDYVKHMNRVVDGKLMLYEFIELYPVCERICDVKKKIQTQTKIKHRRHSSDSTVSEVANFEEILLQDDKKQYDFLDDIYEQSIFRPSFNTKPTWRVPSLDAINNKDWKKQVSSYRQVADGLDATLGPSNKKVVRARNGALGHHVQFVDFNILNEKRKRSKVASTSRESAIGDEKRHVAVDRANNWTINETTTSNAQPRVPHALPPPSPTRMPSDPSKYVSKRSKLTDDKALVTQQALHDTQTKIVNLLWDLEMKDALVKRDSKSTKIDLLPCEEDVEQDKDISVPFQESLEEKSPSKSPEELWSTTAHVEQLGPGTTSRIYSFFSSRLTERDSLLDRDSNRNNSPRTRSRMTRISRTDQGRSRKSARVHDMVDSSRRFLSTA